MNAGVWIATLAIFALGMGYSLSDSAKADRKKDSRPKTEKPGRPEGDRGGKP